MIAHDVEQRSQEWYALRAGLPTASEFSKIITSKGEPSKSAEGYAVTLAIELFTGGPVNDFGGSDYMERGREMEAEALAFYEFTNGVSVTPVGFVTDDAKTMGCSPDGLVGDDGMCEVKCLKAENHVKAILYHQKHGHLPPDYVQQTQGQLMICGRAWCDLIFYHPDIMPPLILRQTPNQPIFDALSREVPLLLAQRDSVLASIHRHADRLAA